MARAIDPVSLAKAERDRMRMVLQVASEGLLAFNDRAQVTFANPAAERLLGRSRNPTLRQYASELIEGRDGDLLEQAVLELLTAEPGTTQQVDCSPPDPPATPRLLMIHLCATRTGVRRAVVASLRDGTSESQTGSELAGARRLATLGNLAADIGRQLNAPLQYVGDNVRFVQDAVDGLEGLARTIRRASKRGRIDPALEEALEGLDVRFWRDELRPAVGQVLEGLDQLRRITAALRDFSRLDHEDPTEIDVNRVVQDALALTHDRWGAVARVRRELDPAVPRVLGRPGELNEVVLHLLTNAVRAIRDGEADDPRGGGRIAVSTRHAGEQVELRITDSGVGIPESIGGRVFDRFFTTSGDDGAGQGLANVRELVNRMGGTIDFESEPGSGTTFRVCLPAGPPAPPPVQLR